MVEEWGALEVKGLSEVESRGAHFQNSPIPRVLSNVKIHAIRNQKNSPNQWKLANACKQIQKISLIPS
jgi:hypothetical protein